jgi:hypothetical protein
MIRQPFISLIFLGRRLSAMLYAVTMGYGTGSGGRKADDGNRCGHAGLIPEVSKVEDPYKWPYTPETLWCTPHVHSEVFSALSRLSAISRSQ